jgi:putative phosphoesterase
LRIGLISDTHDYIENIEKAIKMFKDKEVLFIIHAGDYISPDAVRAFHGTKLIGVLGNNDVYNKSELNNAFNDIGGQLKGEIWEHEVDDIIFAVYHGTKLELKNSLIQSGKYDVVICGHTHRTENTNTGKTLVLNPGTAKGWFFGYNATIGIFDTQSKRMELINI